MKRFKGCLVVIVAVALVLSFGCAKKAIRSDVASTPTQRYEPKAVEVQPAEKPEVKPETPSAESTAALEREKRLQEENLREQTLREKALPEKSLQEEAARREAAAREAALKATKLEPIFFDYDQWSIRDNQKEVMIKDGEWLKAHPNVKVRLEGHCDERGTSEYNLALGQKRAEAVRAFLEGLGISGQRLATISYGEERPLDPGRNEEAWAKNRRVDVVSVR